MEINEEELELKINRVLNGKGLFADRLNDYLNNNNNRNSILWKFLATLGSPKEDNSKLIVLKESDKIGGILLLLHTVNPFSIPQHRFADVVQVRRETVRLYFKKISEIIDFQDASFVPWTIELKQKKEKWYTLKEDFYNILSPLIPITVEPEKKTPAGTQYLINYYESIDKPLNLVENKQLDYAISEFLKKDRKQGFLVLTGKTGSGKTRQIAESLIKHSVKYAIWVNTDLNQLKAEFFEDLEKIKYRSIIFLDNFGEIKNLEVLHRIFSSRTNLQSIKWILAISTRDRDDFNLPKYDLNIDEHLDLFEKDCIDPKILSQRANKTFSLEKKVIMKWWNISKGNWNHFLALCKETLDSETAVEILENKIEVLALLMRTSLFNYLVSYIQQGELKLSNEGLEWIFPIRISEKGKYRFNKDSGDPVTTLIANILQGVSIITGKRGSGKTFASFQLETYQLERVLEAKKLDYFPFRIDLGKIGYHSEDQMSYDGITIYSNELKLTPLLQSSWQSSLKHLNEKERELGLNLLPWIKKIVKTHRIMLILDGWDEISERIVDQVEYFIENLPSHTPIVITSREIPKEFSLPKDVASETYIIDPPTLTEIKAYFKHRWEHFGYKLDSDHFNALNNLPNEFRNPFNIQALSLLPPSSSFPSNEMLLYRRMIHSSVLWDYLKKHTKKQYSRFETYKEVLLYLQKTKHKDFQKFSLIELVQDPKNKNSLFSLVGKIAYQAYHKKSSTIYHEVVRENPLTEYFLEPKIDEESSIINARLLEPHLYHYFASEYLYLHLLNGKLLDIPGTEVLDSFKEILSYDDRWKNSKIGELCNDSNEVIFEYYVNDKIKGTRPLKAGFSDGTFTENYRWGLGIPAYAQSMAQELYTEYKTIREENKKKKILRRLLTELIFDPPQRYMSSGYDIIIKDQDQRFGISKEPYEYKKAIYDLHDLPVDTAITKLIQKSKYNFIFSWLLAYKEGQITPVIAQTAREKLNRLSEKEKELEKSISEFLLAINYKPEVERILLASLTGQNKDFNNFQSIKAPLSLAFQEVTQPGKEWLLENSDPRQIDPYWNKISSLEEMSYHALRIKLSQGNISTEDQQQIIILIKKHLETIQEEQENESRIIMEEDPYIRESWKFRREYQPPNGSDLIELILGPFLQYLIINDENEAINFFKNLYEECEFQGRLYLLELVRRWDLFWLKETLFQLQETSEEPLIFELINILGLWEEPKAIEILKELWKSKKISCKQTLSMIADWIYLEDWPWAEEFILQSSTDCWLKDYHSYNRNIIEIGFKYSEIATIDRIRSLLNDLAEEQKDLGRITESLVRFRYFDEERLELLYDGLNPKVKNKLFKDIYYSNTRMFENFILNHLKEVEDPHVFLIFLSPSRIKSTHERKLLLKERLQKIKWESLGFENGKFEDSYSYNSLIENYWELADENKEREDLEVLFQIWNRLENNKMSLSTLTQILIGEGIEVVEKTVINKIKSVNDFENINNILTLIPKSKGRGEFYETLVDYLPSAEKVYNELDSVQTNNKYNNVREFMTNIQKKEHPLFNDYFVVLWKNVPDKLVYIFLRYTKSQSLSKDLLHLRFSKLPNNVVWLITETWNNEENYHSGNLTNFLKELLISRKDLILNSQITSNRKILIQKVLKEFHKEDEILSVREIHELVRNSPELAEEWEKRWDDIIYGSFSSEDSIEKIVTKITKRLQENDTYLADKLLESLCFNRKEELKRVDLDSNQKSVIKEYLKHIYSIERIKSLYPIYELVKTDKREKKSWETRWEKSITSVDQITFPDVSTNESSPFEGEEDFETDDWRLEFAEESKEEGMKLLNKINQDITKTKEELYSINLDEFFSEMLALNYANASKLATDLSLERITLLKEAITGSHGDGTCFWDYKGAYDNFRSILLDAVIDGEELSYDDEGILLEQLITVIAEFKAKFNDLNVAKYAFNNEVSAETLLGSLSKLHVNQLYPFMILHGFDKWHTEYGHKYEQLKWKRLVYASIIDNIRSSSQCKKEVF